MRRLIVAALLALPGLVSAQNTIFNSPSNGHPGAYAPAPSYNRPAPSYGGSSYDGGSGNSYQSTGSGYRGYNSNTGSTWSAQSFGGRTTGVDSRGNSWSYDNNTGTYQNYGTGEVRRSGSRW